jgi:hypothetical protein
VHVEVPSVQISGAVGHALSIAGHMQEVEGQATGFLARNMDTTAKQFEHAGDEIFQRAVGLQQLENETAAKKAGMEYDVYAGKQEAEFSKKAGEAASAGELKAHMEDLQKKRNEVSGKMSNPAMKRMFDDHSINTLTSKINAAASHAAKETRKAAVGASEGRINLNIDTFAKTDDIKDSERIMEETRKEHFGTAVPLRGWSSDEANARWHEIVDKMIATKATRMGDRDPSRALEMLEENSKSMTGDTYNRVKKTLQDAQDIQRARNIGNRIKQDHEDAPLETRMEEADKKAEEIAPGDGKLKDAVRGRVRNDWAESEREARDLRNRYTELGVKAAQGEFTPSQPLPTKIEELMAVDGFKEAWDNLKNKQRGEILKTLARNAKGDYPETAETRRATMTLAMEAESPKPEDVEAFMARDIEALPIPIKARNKLNGLKLKIAKREGFANADVGEAWRVAGNLIPDNIRKKTSSAWKDYAGALGVALEDELKANKGIKLKPEQIREVVGRLNAYDPDVSWYNIFAKRHYETMRAPTDEELRQIKDRNPGMTEEQLHDEFAETKWHFFQKQYRELMEKGPSSKPSKPPAVPTSQ